PYADYLTREIVPFVDGELRTLADREHRGCFGKSSGGYGALIHGMRYWRSWGAVASHAGDAYFDFVYRSGWPETLTLLARYADQAPGKRPPVRAKGTRKKTLVSDEGNRQKGLAEGLDDGRVARFLEHAWQQPRLAGHEIHTLMNLCMAASYDPDPTAANGFRLPFHLDTGELLKARWRQWLTHDPVNLVGRYRKGLQSLQGLWIDCGWRDQYHIHFGTRQLSKKLTDAGIDHVYEEFDGTHSGIDYRLDRSLPYLYKALAPR
ncbi:MAG: alpha/beta hydrolase-fold protein, partial [Pseudomonadota bacterium]